MFSRMAAGGDIVYEQDRSSTHIEACQKGSTKIMGAFLATQPYLRSRGTISAKSPWTEFVRRKLGRQQFGLIEAATHASSPMDGNWHDKIVSVESMRFVSDPQQLRKWIDQRSDPRILETPHRLGCPIVVPVKRDNLL
jgi:hypothetical protein